MCGQYKKKRVVHLETGIFLVVVLVQRVGHGDDVVDDLGCSERGGARGLRSQHVDHGGAQVHVDAQVVGARGVAVRGHGSRRRRRRILALDCRHRRAHARRVHYILVRSQFRIFLVTFLH